MAITSQQRKTKLSPPETIHFDHAAREEYLTGFHKRKIARIALARAEIEKREKEERVKLRRDLRRQRQLDLETFGEEVNRVANRLNGNTDGPDTTSAEDRNCAVDFNGLQHVEPIHSEDEFIDEGVYTNVVTESVCISKAGFSRTFEKRDEENDGSVCTKRIHHTMRSKSLTTPEKSKQKKTRINFRYESKAERKVERMRQGTKKNKQKAARKAKG